MFLGGGSELFDGQSGCSISGEVCDPSTSQRYVCRLSGIWPYGKLG